MSVSGRTARLSGGGVPPSFSGVGCRRRRLRGCGWNSTRSTLEKGQKWPPARIHFMAAALVQVADVEDVSASNPSPLARKMMRARRKFGRSRLPSDRLGTQPQFQLRLSTPRSGQRPKGRGKRVFSFSIHPSGWSGTCRLPRSVQRPPDPCINGELQQNLRSFDSMST